MKKTIRLMAIAVVLVISAALFASCGGGASTDIDLDSVDYSNVSLTIKAGDYDRMKELVDELGAGKYDRNVIQITGENAKRTSNCSILIKNDKGVGLGVSWEVINGKFPDDYPDDGATITITGVLVKDSNGARVLKVPADKIEK